MNNKILLTLGVGGLLMTTHSATAQIRIGQGGATTEVETAKEWPSLTPLFRSILDQYPEDVKLFENPEFVPRLEALVGAIRVEYMRNHFEFEYPVEDLGRSYSVMACKSGECGYTDFEIQYFPGTNNLCVKYLIEGQQEVIMEKETRVTWTEYNDEEDLGA